MAKEIAIGDVRIPLADYVIGGTAILGTRDSGKTYVGKGIAEQLIDFEIMPIIFDPIGRWRYMKMPSVSAGGRGFKIVVAGGEGADLPLTPESAPAIMRAAMKENIPMVFDLYSPRLSKADWRRIVQACAHIALYENKGLRHLFFEEAAEFAPQKVEDGATYAAIEKLVRMGGNVSVGATLINQRAQEVNKAVLDLCTNLVLMRQRGSKAIEAVEKWIDRLSPSESKKIGGRLPHLQSGECYVFTEKSDEPIFTRTRPLLSFHPDRRKPEQIAVASKRTADTQDFVSRLTGELGTVIEAAKANDPAELRRQLADAQRQVAQLQKGTGTATAEQVEQRRWEGYADGWRECRDEHTKIMASLQDGASTVAVGAENLAAAARAVADATEMTIPEKFPKFISIYPKVGATVLVDTATRPTLASNGEFSLSAINAAVKRGAGFEPLSPSARKIVDAIHRAAPVSLSFEAAARRAGVSSKSSNYRSYKREVAACTEVTERHGKYVTVGSHATPAGADAGVDGWVQRLPPTYGAMLRVIKDHPNIDRDHIATLANVSPTSSGLSAGLRELRDMDLIVRTDDGRYSVAEGL